LTRHVEERVSSRPYTGRKIPPLAMDGRAEMPDSDSRTGVRIASPRGKILCIGATDGANGQGTEDVE
jgi:hypothetical protein